MTGPTDRQIILKHLYEVFLAEQSVSQSKHKQNKTFETQAKTPHIYTNLPPTPAFRSVGYYTTLL